MKQRAMREARNANNQGTTVITGFPGRLASINVSFYCGSSVMKTLVILGLHTNLIINSPAAQHSSCCASSVGPLFCSCI
jgi:hypothetical protein